MKKILTDCDGVLLDWEAGLHEWMQERNYTRTRMDSYAIHVRYKGMAEEEAERLITEFNNSSRIAFLTEFRDAIPGVAKLVEHGYRFDCITSLSADPYTKMLRRINLDNKFGPVVDELICIKDSIGKDAELAKYKDTGYWWIEDLPKNCEAGLKQGLRPILINHPHNMWYNSPDVIRVENWEEICEVILSE